MRRAPSRGRRRDIAPTSLRANSSSSLAIEFWPTTGGCEGSPRALSMSSFQLAGEAGTWRTCRAACKETTMRIAEVSPLFESVPPKYYGGTERVVAYLVDELMRQGHQVTLFASGDSVTSAELISPCRDALRLSGRFGDWLPYYLLMLEQVYQQRERFDVIHFHIDYVHFPVSRRERVPQLTTLHG